MLVSTALRVRDIMYLILMLEICIITVIVKGHQSINQSIIYFNTLRQRAKKLVQNTNV